MRGANLASLFAALLSGSCCIVPVVLLTIGFTSLGHFGFLMQYRVLTLGLSALLIAASFYWVYRAQAQAACRSGVCTLQALRRTRIIVWFSVLMMAVYILLSEIP